jgi:hypothetical protein
MRRKERARQLASGGWDRGSGLETRGSALNHCRLLAKLFFPLNLSFLVCKMKRRPPSSFLQDEVGISKEVSVWTCGKVIAQPIVTGEVQDLPRSV